METDLKVYIHGRPQGQDVWCSGEYSSLDKQYIDPYLDSKIGSDVESVLIIDTWETDTYYTYLHRKDVFEYSRAQGYFAITLRITGGYCRNVSKLFALLDKLFEQKCLNCILRKENGEYRYLIRKFAEINADIKDIETIIKTNFQHLLAPFVTEVDYKSNTLSLSPQKYSLQEVDSPVFYEESRNAKIVLSKDYPTRASLLASELDKCRAQLNNLSGQIELVSQQARDAYQGQLSEKIKLLNEKQNEIDRLNQEIQRIAQENEGLKNKEQKINKNSDILSAIDDIRGPFISFARLLAGRFPGGGQTAGEVLNSNDKKRYKIRISEMWLIWINTIVIIVSFISVCIMLNGVRNSYDNWSTRIGEVLDKNGERNSPVTATKEIPVVIDIAQNKSGKLEVGSQYGLTAKIKSDYNEKGKTLEEFVNDISQKMWNITSNGGDGRNFVADGQLLVPQLDSIVITGDTVVIKLCVEPRTVYIKD